MLRTSLALTAALLLTACSESAEERTPEEAAEAAAPQETEFTGDIGAATREAAADTEAAARDAGTALDGAVVTGDAPVDPAQQPVER